MIRSQLEYASDVWDHHHVGDIMELEKAKRRAACWVLNDYGRFSSVTVQITHNLKQYTHVTRLSHACDTRVVHVTWVVL